MALKKYKPLSPDPYIGRTRGDNEVARFAHLNHLIDQLGSGTGVGGGVTEVTYTDLQSLISSSQLSPGTTYKITGFNKNMPSGSDSNPNGYLPEVLYDDSTNSGITIYMQAVTTNTLATSGYGEFYNPKYGDQTTYYNTDGTGLYGIWDGDNPNEEDIPEYSDDFIVFWGGYAWQSLNGNVGYAVNSFTLNPQDWVKVPYFNDTYYTKVIDEIKVDWGNGIVVERYNPENQIRVAFNADQYDWWVGYDYTFDISISPIAGICWGLYSKVTPEQFDDDFHGISNINCINSIVDIVNFKGMGLININCNIGSFDSNYIGKFTYISELEINTWGSFYNNIVTNNASVWELSITSAASVQSNNLTGGSRIYKCKLSIDSRISNNNLSQSSQIGYCILLDNSYINFNELTNSSNINNNTINKSSWIYSNELSNAYIQNNILSVGSFIQNNNLGYNGGIAGNELSTGSNINNILIYDNGVINDNKLKNSTINDTGIVNGGQILYNNLLGSRLKCTNSDVSQTIRLNNFTGVDAAADYTSATHIYGNYTKEIISRPDGTPRLIYYNNSNVLQNVAVNS